MIVLTFAILYCDSRATEVLNRDHRIRPIYEVKSVILDLEKEIDCFLLLAFFIAELLSLRSKHDIGFRSKEGTYIV